MTKTANVQVYFFLGILLHAEINKSDLICVWCESDLECQFSKKQKVRNSSPRTVAFLKHTLKGITIVACHLARLWKMIYCKLKWKLKKGKLPWCHATTAASETSSANSKNSFYLTEHVRARFYESSTEPMETRKCYKISEIKYARLVITRVSVLKLDFVLARDFYSLIFKYHA